MKLKDLRFVLRINDDETIDVFYKKRVILSFPKQHFIVKVRYSNRLPYFIIKGKEKGGECKVYFKRLVRK